MENQGGLSVTELGDILCAKTDDVNRLLEANGFQTLDEEGWQPTVNKGRLFLAGNTNTGLIWKPVVATMLRQN